jgi:hypothetical protein
MARQRREYAEQRPEFLAYFEDEQELHLEMRWRARRKIRYWKYISVGFVIAIASSYAANALWYKWPLWP